MIKRLLKKKTGVTILEGLIALGLLALVAGGTFGVLLSVSRKTSQPDIREEMLLAIERASEQLQMYTYSSADTAKIPDEFQKGLCGESSSFSSVLSGRHNISCMLPAICDRDNSSFYYEMGSATMDNPLKGLGAAYSSASTDVSSYLTRKAVSFEITCNGFTL